MKKSGMSTNRSGSWLPPRRLELVQLGDVLGPRRTARAGQRRPLGQQPRCGASRSRPAARPEGAPVPRRQGLNLRWLLSLEVAGEVLQPLERLPVLCPVRPPLALDDVVDRAQREAVHLDRRRRVLVPFDPVRSVDQVEVVRSVCQLDEVPASPDFFGQLVVDLEAQLPERADQPVAVIGRPAWCARRCGSDTTRARAGSCVAAQIRLLCRAAG